jgi:hypothetical protein
MEKRKKDITEQTAKDIEKGQITATEQATRHETEQTK